MNKNVLNFAGCLALSLAAGSVSAANWFVSADGTWAMTNAAGQAMTGTKTTSLQTAVSAIHTAADIVWVQDGFVCSMTEDAGNISGTSSGKARIKLHASAFTLRSESGYVDEAAGKGAYIRGNKKDLSDGAIRPIWSQNKGTIIQGFVLEDGATGNVAGCGGGAIYGPAIVSNCIIRNCTAYTGGAFASGGRSAAYGRVYNTVITNCSALVGSGGVVDGATSFYNCRLEKNFAQEFGGAVYYNKSVAGYNPAYVDCSISDNVATTAGAIYVGSMGKTIMFDHCQILDNVATEADGAVSGNATLLGCVLSGNKAASGAAAFSTESTTNCFNCAFVNNVSESGCIVSGPQDLLNCTVARNTSGGNCVIGITFKNSIIWKNKYEGLELAGCTATYSCQKDLTTGMGNITTDPKLTTDNRLSVDSPCVGTAKFETWMTAGDARSFDAAGYPRLRRSLPDMGAYALENPGAMVIGR